MNNYFSVENNSPILTIIILLTIMLGLLSATVEGNEFRSSCKKPLEQAAASSSISIATEQLVVVKAGCQPFLSTKELEFWHQNLEQQEKNLSSIDSTATTQEKYLVLNSEFSQTLCLRSLEDLTSLNLS